MKPPKPSIEDGVAAVEHFINHLRGQQVRSFKGELLGPDGAVLWRLELSFDREAPKPARDPREY